MAPRNNEMQSNAEIRKMRTLSNGGSMNLSFSVRPINVCSGGNHLSFSVSGTCGETPIDYIINVCHTDPKLRKETSKLDENYIKEVITKEVVTDLQINGLTKLKDINDHVSSKVFSTSI